MAPGQARAGRDPEPRTPEGRKSMPIRYLPDLALSRKARRIASNASSITPGLLAAIGTPPPRPSPPPPAPPAAGGRPGAPPRHPRRQPGAPARLVDRDAHDRLVRGHADDRHHRGPLARYPAAHVERELADVVGFGAILRAV